MTQEMIKLADFVRDNRIAMTAERVDRNPHNPDWTDADHWRVKFTRGELKPNPRVEGGMKTKTSVVARMTTYFSMGYGHNGAEPEAKDVLDCLASDSRYVDRSFEEWADDMGYDADSRKAERIYKACERGAARLKAFLGDELFETLLWGTESE